MTNEPLPIDAAPVRAGEEFGPVLLKLHQDEANFPDFAPWEVGAWAGGNWYVLDGPIVHPTHWAPLPDLTPSRPRYTAWIPAFAIVMALASNSAFAGGGFMAGFGPALLDYSYQQQQMQSPHYAPPPDPYYEPPHRAYRPPPLPPITTCMKSPGGFTCYQQ